MRSSANGEPFEPAWKRPSQPASRPAAFRSDADPVVTAKVIFDAVLGAFRHLEPIGAYTPDELTRELTTFILNGLRAGSA